VASRRERIGVFGGTFDPPHIGHLVAALYSFEAISLDRLLFVVANVPWQKTDQRRVTPAADRVRMVEAAVGGHPGFEVSRVEIELGGRSYMAVTLEELRRRLPAADFFLVLGADAAAGIPTWHRIDRLPHLAEVVVVDRPGTDEVSLPGFTIHSVTMPALDISSTDLRARLHEGRSVDWLVPEGVRSVIAELGLYREES
jgi:nicotinate-nucleotide adenylyltransferase